MTENVQIMERDFKAAVKDGLALKCPNCSEGNLLHNYLKVNSHCSACNQDFKHQRADDAPAYITILVVVHLVGFIAHLLISYATLSNLALFLVLSTIATILALFILPRAKGMVIAIQWAKRMHGF